MARVLVTGAASGIGRGAAIVFAREGAKVVVTDGPNIEGGHETVRLISEAGGEATFVKCDVSKETDVEAMVTKTVELYGSLDLFSSHFFGCHTERHKGLQLGGISL